MPPRRSRAGPSSLQSSQCAAAVPTRNSPSRAQRSEEHTSELQSPDHLVCRLLLEKKNKNDTRLHKVFFYTVPGYLCTVLHDFIVKSHRYYGKLLFATLPASPRCPY